MASPHKGRILIVDDSPKTLEVLQRNLDAKGYTVFTARNVSDALGVLEAETVDLVITDLKMPGESGLDLVRYVNENLKITEVMVITGYPSVQGAVTAVKTGAEESLAKPFTDEELFSAVDRSFDKLMERKARMSHPAETRTFPGLIGDSDAMRKVLSSIEKAAATPATALITGESGTGKELIARAVHYRSARGKAPFVPVNCGGIPEGLLESELFGYVKGAFTSATESRAGFFQTADGGTIFLDEIGDTSVAMQVKLLRVLENKEVCMIGGRTSRKVDVRILAATNKDLHGLVKKGAFREDLYFRLNVITIEAPPLRERGNDVLILMNHFASKFAGELGKPVPRFSDDVLQAMKHYDWPGNVRELENTVQRIVVMSDDVHVEVPDLPSNMRCTIMPGSGFNRTLEEVERDHIMNVLVSVNGNKTQAARILGIDRKTLRKKLEIHKLPSS
jgi:two-component system response regulator HydG